MNGLSTVEEVKSKAKKVKNTMHALAYSEMYLRLSRGDYETRQNWVLDRSHELWWNTVGATYWSIR